MQKSMRLFHQVCLVLVIACMIFCDVWSIFLVVLKTPKMYEKSTTMFTKPNNKMEGTDGFMGHECVLYEFYSDTMF